ncbi:MAG: hypothetical protein PHV30_02590 [Candidatus Margulisbacteria bacterium]|nr:hypothetical protein [Candidatus Margulisiibacteriota bacterium]
MKLLTKIISVTDKLQISKFLQQELDMLATGLNIFTGNHAKKVLGELVALGPEKTKLLLSCLKTTAKSKDLSFLAFEKPSIDKTSALREAKTSAMVSIHSCISNLSSLTGDIILEKLARDFGKLGFSDKIDIEILDKKKIDDLRLNLANTVREACADYPSKSNAMWYVYIQDNYINNELTKIKQSLMSSPALTDGSSINEIEIIRTVKGEVLILTKIKFDKDETDPNKLKIANEYAMSAARMIKAINPLLKVSVSDKYTNLIIGGNYDHFGSSFSFYYDEWYASTIVLEL